MNTKDKLILVSVIVLISFQITINVLVYKNWGNKLTSCDYISGGFIGGIDEYGHNVISPIYSNSVSNLFGNVCEIWNNGEIELITLSLEKNTNINQFGSINVYLLISTLLMIITYSAMLILYLTK